MFEPVKQIDNSLTDDERCQIWLADPITSEIYRQWYSVNDDCLPAQMAHKEWWPEDGVKFNLSVPESTRDWLPVHWPTLQADFTELAEICSRRRSSREMLADSMSIFWYRHNHAARVLLAAHFIPALMVRLGLDGLDSQLHGKTLLLNFSDGDPKAIDCFEDLLDEQDVWIEHINWFFSGGIRAHAPKSEVAASSKAGAPPPPPAGPAP